MTYPDSLIAEAVAILDALLPPYARLHVDRSSDGNVCVHREGSPPIEGRGYSLAAAIVSLAEQVKMTGDGPGRSVRPARPLP